MRVRGDQLQPGDTYVWGNGSTDTIRTIEKRKQKTAGGATITRIVVTFDGGALNSSCAPHSKHTIRRGATTTSSKIVWS